MKISKSVSVVIPAHNEERCIAKVRNAGINAAEGDWLYFKLMFGHMDAFIKAAFGNTKDMDALLNQIFYDYNDNSFL